MSVFKTQVKTFRTKITGEELELKINNMVWITLQEKFGVSQKAYAEQGEDERIVMAGKFIAALLVSNGYDVTLDEVLENTNEADITDFNLSYNKMLQSETEKVFEKHFPKQTQKKANEK